ncbi:ATP-binding protein [uncultured Vagococcus sp.]|uniref:ATP-binding protein n=1 Tax=uncultured Vagococcus sp. TaxID=189676 RepID=UPI002585D5D9|nr:ATP-binding protein [uncultured Vagococcus sp.]
MNNLEIGMVVEVNGMQVKIATYDNSNHSTFIHNGDIIKNVSVNSFILVEQGFNRIVCRINAESIWDVHNNSKDYQFNSSFIKNSIKRILDVQVIGYIFQNEFSSGATFIPMIGNVCSIPTKQEILQIYLNSFESVENDNSIVIGKSINEQNEIKLPVNSFFASHIGVFGNTGSGKSNTLHKLYYELFKLNHPNLKSRSNFVVLDFNGEYIHDKSFGISNNLEKKVYDLSTRTSNCEKYPISASTFYDVEMLSIIFQATNQTQKPFLNRVLRGRKKYKDGINSICNWIRYLMEKILTSSPNLDLKNMLLNVIESMLEPTKHIYLAQLKTVQLHTYVEVKYIFTSINGTTEYINGEWETRFDDLLNLESLFVELNTLILNDFEDFELRCKLQLINDLLYGNVVSSHIDPLLKRIESRIYNMSNYLEIIDRIDNEHFLEIVSLKNLNQEAKQTMAIFISKMYFDFHKLNDDKGSFHLIIDEAHNILSYQVVSENESWRDYRLSIFEEIIKEGRKFGFFLTISSQRPADISSTLLSQVHNFFLHKLVNEKDLQIVENSLSTLDRTSKSMLPSLSQGVCIVTGTALSLPLIMKVDFIFDKSTRPQSDTINLLELWNLKTE